MAPPKNSPALRSQVIMSSSATWSRVTPSPPRMMERKTPKTLMCLAAALVVPAVVMLAQPRPSRSALLAGKVAAFEADIGRRPHQAVRAAAATGLIQEISSRSKTNLVHNVKTMLAYTGLQQEAQQKVSVQNPSADKVKVTMFMESECPGCRWYSTTFLKEVLETPGMDDIVDFHAVSWGFAKVVEAPTPSQEARNETQGSFINTTLSLLSLARSLSDPFTNQEVPAFRFGCQHGFAECQGNALQACLQDVEPETSKFFPVYDCIEARTCAEGMKPPKCVGTPVEVAQGCFEKHGVELNVKGVMECYNGQRAQTLLVMNDIETLEAKPEWVPWVTIDGKPIVSQAEIDKNTSLAFKSQQLLGSKICNEYVAKTGKSAPAACAAFPQTLDELPSDAEMKKKYPERDFTKLIEELKQQAKMRDQAAQQNLAWQLQAENNYAQRQQEQQEEVRERREAMQQEKRAQQYAKKHPGAGQLSSAQGWRSWVADVWRAL